MFPQEKTCPICFNDGFKPDQMFVVAFCSHQFCLECTKRHIEVKLLEGTSVPRCLHYQCQSKLSFRSCANVLTPKFRAIWEQRIKEESIRVTERIYCPNPKCSVLMSKTEISKFNDGARRCCVKCCEPFCINCEVPWHYNLSCDDYNRLNPNHTDLKFKALAKEKMWQQCGKCQHMVELSKGCIHMVCRCGYSFCYTCGAQWKLIGGSCRHQQKLYVANCAVLSFFLLAVLAIIYCIIRSK